MRMHGAAPPTMLQVQTNASIIEGSLGVQRNTFKQQSKETNKKLFLDKNHVFRKKQPPACQLLVKFDACSCRS